MNTSINHKNTTIMKKAFLVFIIIVTAVSGGIYVQAKLQGKSKKKLITKEIPNGLEDAEVFRDGDIIFQKSLSRQCKAVQIATNSPYSHCGIIYNNDGELFVFEAIQPVRITPFEEWIARGEKEHYVVKRLKNADRILTRDVVERMRKEGNRMMDKNYDITFEWSDDRIYCSELVWKLYKRAAGIEVGKLERLGDFNLSDKTVHAIIKERYGNNVPLNETVISPKSIFDSELLLTVVSK